jgi:hypothetical protein
MSNSYAPLHNVLSESNSYAPLRNVLSENGLAPPRKILHSWKEIASFIGCGVRTVQRYEVQFGFPVHRPAGTMRSAVLAFSDEVEAWLLQTPTASQLVRSFNVIQMPAVAQSNHEGEVCPLCEGTGRARLDSISAGDATKSDAAGSQKRRASRVPGQQADTSPSNGRRYQDDGMHKHSQRRYSTP